MFPAPLMVNSVRMLSKFSNIPPMSWQTRSIVIMPVIAVGSGQIIDLLIWYQRVFWQNRLVVTTLK